MHSFQLLPRPEGILLLFVFSQVVFIGNLCFRILPPEHVIFSQEIIIACVVQGIQRQAGFYRINFRLGVFLFIVNIGFQEKEFCKTVVYSRFVQHF